MECPRCKTKLTHDPYRGTDTQVRRERLRTIVHAAGVEIECCESCGGVFLDHGELQKIQDAARGKGASYEAPTRLQRVYARAERRGPGVDPEETEEIRCPACGGEMASRNWGFGSEVTVDTCIECRGVWLDEGELEALEDVFR